MRMTMGWPDCAKRSFSAILALAVGLSAAPALAQSYQCRVPERVSLPQIRPDGPTRRVPVTGYTLALSWSPEFCKGQETSARHRFQCSGSNGRFGFIVHGLWPEGRNTYPQWCATPRRPSPAEARKNLCMMPSERLVAHEWAKHGSCMTRRPETYFKVTRILWGALAMPDMDRISREEGLTAGLIRQSIARANPGLEAEEIGLKLNRRGWLQEARICYGKDFRPARCTARQFGPQDSTPAKIWRGL